MTEKKLLQFWIENCYSFELKTATVFFGVKRSFQETVTLMS